MGKQNVRGEMEEKERRMPMPVGKKVLVLICGLPCDSDLHYCTTSERKSAIAVRSFPRVQCPEIYVEYTLVQKGIEKGYQAMNMHSKG